MGDPLDRRDLFRLGLTAGAVLVGGATLAACHADAAKPATGPHGAPGELDELTIAELSQRMAAGTESAVSLLHKYLARIAAMNEAGPQLRAVLELDPDAKANAVQLDAERAAGKLRGPLHGIPMLVKDNLDTGGKLTTTAGSLALAGTHAAKDSFVVAQLRAAGALVFGKANLSEWANIRGNPSSSGWSGRGGQCRNPYALDRSPSGSSSGSAVATAANLCAAAIGSETDGSITAPASCNALVGIKPTVGLVSRSGIIPISGSQDTAGPMTRTVTDAAVILGVIAGPDPADPVTTQAHPLRPASREDYTKHLDRNALAGARIGVPREGWFGRNRNMDAVAEAALGEFKRLGAILVDPIELEVAPTLGPAEIEVLLTELKAGIADYLRGRGPDTKVRTLADLIAFNKAHAAEELTVFGQEEFELAEKKGSLTDKAYLDARATCIELARTKGIDKAMDGNQLDAIFAATYAPAGLIDLVNGDVDGAYGGTLPAVAGYPHISIPAGQFRGLPMGISLFGRPFSEGKLLGYAFAYEQASKQRRPPTFQATALDR